MDRSHDCGEKDWVDLDARNLNELGNAYSNYGMWEEARACYQRSLALRREVQDRRGEMIVLNNLGALYHRLERWEEALECYRASLVRARELGEEESELAILMNLAFIQFALGQDEEFLSLADEAERLGQGLERWESLATLSRLRGRLAFEASAMEEAMAYYAQALRYAAQGETVGEALHSLDQEIERLLSQGRRGWALAFCDYLLAACGGVEKVNSHLRRKREELLRPPCLP
jgi:tetratricopeptide (TPR) repeat protein